MDNEKIKRILVKEFAGKKIDFFVLEELKKRVLQLTGFHKKVSFYRGRGITVEEFTEGEYLLNTKDYYAGGFMAIPKDAPDGAWMQMHLDTAEYLLTECPKSLFYKTPPTINAHKIVQFYLETR